MFLSAEALFLGSSDQYTIFDQRRSRVVIKTRDSQYIN